MNEQDLDFDNLDNLLKISTLALPWKAALIRKRTYCCRGYARVQNLNFRPSWKPANKPLKNIKTLRKPHPMAY